MFQLFSNIPLSTIQSHRKKLHTQSFAFLSSNGLHFSIRIQIKFVMMVVTLELTFLISEKGTTDKGNYINQYQASI